jgi:hypothetical protein
VVRVQNELAQAADPGQRRWFGWAPLGRPVARWATRERSKGRLGWAGGEVLTQGHFFMVKPFSIFQTILQFANYFEFSSILNFE